MQFLKFVLNYKKVMDWSQAVWLACFRLEVFMSKGKDVKKPVRKKAQKTLKEKRQEKNSKKDHVGVVTGK